MARAGRKRKSRGYNPGRKPVNEPKEQKLGMTPEMFDQRKRVVGAENVLSWDGSQIHALKLREIITTQQLEAGRKFDALAKRMRDMMCVPKQSQGVPQRAAYHDDPEEFANIKAAYNDAVLAMGGIVYVRQITRLLRGEEFHVAKVKKALGKLEIFFRIPG